MFKYIPDDVLEGKGFVHRDEKVEIGSIFETAVGADMILEMAGQQTRSKAMATALTWIDEHDYSFDALDAIVVGLADVNTDGDINDDEEEAYNELLGATGAALVALSASADLVQKFIDDEDDAAGEKIGSALAKKMDNVEQDDDTLVTRFAAKGDAIFEATMKVIRNGRVILKKKPVRKRRLNAAQRAALKKARRKSNTAAARRNRKKSMRQRKKRGL